MKPTQASLRFVVFSVLLFSWFVALPLRAEHQKYLADSHLDPIALLAPPPILDSPEQTADLAEVRAVHAAASESDVAKAASETKFDVFTFAPVVGSFFQAAGLPKTTTFFHHVQKEAKAVTDEAKDYWKRPRPYVTDPSLAPDRAEKSFSYPSGHSTESMVLALTLAQLFPDKREAILAEARGIGWRRVEIARHYPTDIYAGRVLAQAIFRAMQESSDFQRDLAEAEAEIAAARGAAGN